MTEQAKTREEYRKINEEKKKVEVIRPKRKRIRVRMFPIWLRFIVLLVLIVVFMSAGAAVGYGVIGSGKTMDVFKVSTWTHISDLVSKK
jgi:flagellar basal body-associated protein FliL